LTVDFLIKLLIDEEVRARVRLISSDDELPVLDFLDRVIVFCSLAWHFVRVRHVVVLVSLLLLMLFLTANLLTVFFLCRTRFFELLATLADMLDEGVLLSVAALLKLSPFGPVRFAVALLPSVLVALETTSSTTHGLSIVAIEVSLLSLLVSAWPSTSPLRCCFVVAVVVPLHFISHVAVMLPPFFLSWVLSLERPPLFVLTVVAVILSRRVMVVFVFEVARVSMMTVIMMMTVEVVLLGSSLKTTMLSEIVFFAIIGPGFLLVLRLIMTTRMFLPHRCFELSTVHLLSPAFFMSLPFMTRVLVVVVTMITMINRSSAEPLASTPTHFLLSLSNRTRPLSKELFTLPLVHLLD
jgi:hypothetical protein